LFANIGVVPKYFSNSVANPGLFKDVVGVFVMSTASTSPPSTYAIGFIGGVGI
jgi:hypothetical protein